MNLSIRRIATLADIPATEWNNLINNANPFLRHEFLAGLERYQCLDDHGWYPNHLAVFSGEKLVGALPVYFKSNSLGEFVFDWDWAEAYQRAGGQYYPKIVSAIPFTPVMGERLLVHKDELHKDEIKDLLITSAIDLAEKSGVSGLHCLFPDEDDCNRLSQRGLSLRLSCQYHWFNNGYRDFNDFLETLTSKKRKQIRRERRSVREAGIDIETLRGSEIHADQWTIFHEFYCSTFHRKWGEPRLTLAFFQSLSQALPDSTLLFMARHKGKYVAGAFAMQGSDTLFGRHWGCDRHFRYLHFELCYYQTIEYCIRHGLKKFDAGAQGEYKISRGFNPVRTWSAHWINNMEFRKAVENYLLREQQHMEHYIDELSTHSPYKQCINHN